MSLSRHDCLAVRGLLPSFEFRPYLDRSNRSKRRAERSRGGEPERREIEILLSETLRQCHDRVCHNEMTNASMLRDFELYFRIDGENAW
jgi:hypothetical protein